MQSTWLCGSDVLALVQLSLPGIHTHISTGFRNDWIIVILQLFTFIHYSLSCFYLRKRFRDCTLSSISGDLDHMPTSYIYEYPILEPVSWICKTINGFHIVKCKLLIYWFNCNTLFLLHVYLLLFSRSVNYSSKNQS